ncbi:hypothetical protein BS47DRAFT_1379339 [Hydnum rufescens UP504]|uniref:Uncharacterized protein n=1 Tax=Hydnum rufescens UP504 TaxID=1448309 RepID=A0A9P6B8E4_9AGAM|nr:hypothetical protein BS47DRAFT_1379339 [Hydnum rufescens UP504]
MAPCPVQIGRDILDTCQSVSSNSFCFAVEMLYARVDPEKVMWPVIARTKETTLKLVGGQEIDKFLYIANTSLASVPRGILSPSHSVLVASSDVAEISLTFKEAREPFRTRNVVTGISTSCSCESRVHAEDSAFDISGVLTHLIRMASMLRQ